MHPVPIGTGGFHSRGHNEWKPLVENLTARDREVPGVWKRVQTEEFDPGSERTLAAWLRHASRTDVAGLKMKVTLVANG